MTEQNKANKNRKTRRIILIATEIVGMLSLIGLIALLTFGFGGAIKSSGQMIILVPLSVIGGLGVIASFITTHIKYLLYIPSYFYGALILLPIKKFTSSIQTKKQQIQNSNWLFALTPLGFYEIFVLIVFGMKTNLLMGSILNGLMWVIYLNLPLLIGGIGSIWLRRKDKHYKKAFFPMEMEDEFYDTKGKSITLGEDKEYINLTPKHKSQKLLIERKATGTHLAIIGTTGSGKTETAKHFLLDQAKQDQPTIYVDGKGDDGLKKDLRAFCKATGQKFYVFTIDKEEGSSIYNGLDGTPSQIKDKLITLFNLGDSKGASDYFNTKAKNHLTWLIKSLYERDNQITLIELLNLFDPTDLFELAKSQKDLFLKTELKKMRATEEKDLEGLYGKLLELYNDTKDTMNGDGFTIEQALKENAFVLFSLNSLQYQSLAGGLGKFIVQDIKQSSKVNGKLNKKTLLVLDEFNVFADDNVIDVLNKTRSFGYRVMLLFQSLADLSKVSIDFQEQVLGNTNTKILMKVIDNKTKEYFIKAFGEGLHYKESFDAEGGGVKYTEAKEEIITMEQLNSFAIGECVVSTIIKNKPVYYNKTTQVGLVDLKGLQND